MNKEPRVRVYHDTPGKVRHEAILYHGGGITIRTPYPDFENLQQFQKWVKDMSTLYNKVKTAYKPHVEKDEKL